MALWDIDRMIAFFEKFTLNGPELVSIGYYGKLCEYLSDKKSFTLNYSFSECSNEDVECHFMDSILGNYETYGFPLCGADEGKFGFHVSNDFPNLAPALCEEALEKAGYESFKAFEEAFSSVNEYNFRCISLDGKTNEEKETRYHALFDEGGIWDSFCELIPDYFSYIKTSLGETEKKYLMGLYLDGVTATVDEEETGIDYQQIFYFSNPSAGEWANFLKGDVVSKEDREQSSKLFLSLLNEIDGTASYSSSVCVASYSENDSLAFYQPYETTECTLQIQLIVAGDVEYSGYRYTEFILHELLDPGIMLVMLKIVRFLKQMDDKYHYLPEGWNGGINEEISGTAA